jgi:hypothetical protein
VQVGPRQDIRSIYEGLSGDALGGDSRHALYPLHVSLDPSSWARGPSNVTLSSNNERIVSKSLTFHASKYALATFAASSARLLSG